MNELDAQANPIDQPIHEPTTTQGPEPELLEPGPARAGHRRARD